MPTNIHQIPQELVDSIIKLLSRADLKNSRFISRAWNSDYARRCLFKTIILRPNILSYNKLRAILRVKAYRKYIEYIIYDLRTLKLNPGDEGLTRWKENIAGTGLGLQRRAITELVQQCSLDQVEMCHRNYCQYIDGQESIQNFEDEHRILGTVRDVLPNLKGLEYSYQKNPMYQSLQVLNLASLGPMAQWMLVEPDAVMGEEKAERRFWYLINSLIMGRRDSIKEFRLTDFKAHSLQRLTGPRTIPHYKQFLPLLERLFLRTTKYSDAEEYNELIDMLKVTCNLKQLELSFGVMEKEHGVSLSMELHKFVKGDNQWNKLTTLSLDGFTTSEEYLQHLLRRLAPSLDTLSLANISLQKQAPSYPATPPSGAAKLFSGPVKFTSGGTGGHGSWIKLVIFLHNEMKLTSVSFQGRLYSPWDESWEVAGHRSGNCLKNRVERYAAAARHPMAEFPFRRAFRSKEGMSEVRVKGRGEAAGKGQWRGKVRGLLEEERMYPAYSSVVEDDESWRVMKLD